MIMNTPSTTLFIIRTMFRVLQMNSVQLGPSPQTISKFLCFLVSSGIWMTNRGWSERAESQVSVLLRSAPRVTIWSNEKAYIWAAEAPNRPAVSEGVLVSIQDNQYTLSFLSPCLPTFTRFHSSALPPPLPPSLRSLAGFRTGLHLPGRLGWWSPLPRGLGRPPGLLLVEQKKKIYVSVKHS